MQRWVASLLVLLAAGLSASADPPPASPPHDVELLIGTFECSANSGPETNRARASLRFSGTLYRTRFAQTVDNEIFRPFPFSICQQLGTRMRTTVEDAGCVSSAEENNVDDPNVVYATTAFHFVCKGSRADVITGMSTMTAELFETMKTN